MKPEIFILWMRGFIAAGAAANNGGLSPEQVAALLAEAAKVELRGVFRAQD